MKLRPSTTDHAFTLVVLAVLVIGVFLVLQPFISAIVWAAVLAATTWPVFAWLRRRLAGRSGLAATLATLLILLVVVTPFLVVGDGNGPQCFVKREYPTQALTTECPDQRSQGHKGAHLQASA